MAGHLHPCVNLGGRAFDSLRLPCFHFKPHVGMLPAFGSFTGMHPIRWTVIAFLHWRTTTSPRYEKLRVFRSCPLITPKDPCSSLQMLAIARAMAVLCA